MSGRPAQFRQADVKRALSAARAAGYARARVITHPDGRIEIVGENMPEASAAEQSPFEQWKAGNARQT